LRVTGPIFALDLGSAFTGWASGCASERPTSGTIPLKLKTQGREIAFGNLMAFLGELWIKQIPALVVKESPLPLQGYKNASNSQAAVQIAYGLHGIVEGLAARFGIRCESIHDATIRKFFIGKGRLGSRPDTKAAVVQRCHLLKLMPRECQDEDRADALAVWSWASATYGGRAADVLHLFGERAA